MNLFEALAQNPQSPAPQDILDALRLLEVEHYGFDGKLYQGQIVVHAAVSEDVEQFFKRAQEIAFPIAKVIPISDSRYAWDDERSCGDNNSSAFNYRLKSGSSSELSNHARGLAFDINPVQNVYIRYDKNLNEIFRFPSAAPYEPSASGTLTSNHPLVLLMKDAGWEWGGDWTPESGRIDYQHFEKRL